MKLLLLSSSRKGQEGYLESARTMMLPHLNQCQSALFIPYAGVTTNWDDYTKQIQDALPELTISGIHQHTNGKQAIEQAQAILVGGGNTFNLLHHLYQRDLMTSIRRAVSAQTPYVGWSAGSNICGQTICTTNDMPIIQPESFAALNMLPLQLNPHYSDYQPPGHNGETRAQRIKEYCTLNPDTPVIGIREGSALLREDDKLTLIGELDGVKFIGNQQIALFAGQDLSDLL